MKYQVVKKSVRGFLALKEEVERLSGEFSPLCIGLIERRVRVCHDEGAVTLSEKEVANYTKKIWEELKNEI